MTASCPCTGTTPSQTMSETSFGIANFWGSLEQSRGFIEAAEDIHALQCLATRPFSEIVDGARQQDASGMGIQGIANLAKIGHADMFGIGQNTRWQNPHERLRIVGIVKGLLNILKGRPWHGIEKDG